MATIHFPLDALARIWIIPNRHFAIQSRRKEMRPVRLPTMNGNGSSSTGRFRCRFPRRVVFDTFSHSSRFPQPPQIWGQERWGGASDFHLSGLTVPSRFLHPRQAHNSGNIGRQARWANRLINERSCSSRRLRDRKSGSTPGARAHFMHHRDGGVVKLGFADCGPTLNPPVRPNRPVAMFSVGRKI